MARQSSIASMMAQMAQTAQPGQSADSGLFQQAPNMMGAERPAMAGARPPGAPPMPGAHPVVRPPVQPPQPIPQIALAQMPQASNLGTTAMALHAMMSAPQQSSTQNLMRLLYPGG